MPQICPSLTNATRAALSLIIHQFNLQRNQNSIITYPNLEPKLSFQQTQSFHRVGQRRTSSESVMGRVRGSARAAAGDAHDGLRPRSDHQALAGRETGGSPGRRRVLQAGRPGETEPEFNSYCK